MEEKLSLEEIFVLNSLLDKDKTGFEIIQDLKSCHGLFLKKEGLLYPILHQLEQGSFIASYYKKNQNGEKRKYYRLSLIGVKSLNNDESLTRYLIQKSKLSSDNL